MFINKVSLLYYRGKTMLEKNVQIADGAIPLPNPNTVNEEKPLYHLF